MVTLLERGESSPSRSRFPRRTRSQSRHGDKSPHSNTPAWLRISIAPGTGPCQMVDRAAGRRYDRSSPQRHRHRTRWKDEGHDHESAAFPVSSSLGAWFVGWFGHPARRGPKRPRDLLKRLLRERAGEFVFESIPAEDGRDVFEIETRRRQDRRPRLQRRGDGLRAELVPEALLPLPRLVVRRPAQAARSAAGGAAEGSAGSARSATATASTTARSATRWPGGTGRSGSG